MKENNLKKGEYTKLAVVVVAFLFVGSSLVFVLLGNTAANEVIPPADPPGEDYFVPTHTATAAEIEDIKQQVGVYNVSDNYVVTIDGYTTGWMPPTDEEWAQRIGVLQVVETNNPSYPITVTASAVDLSADPEFPIVRSQGSQGSCAAWAATYYATGYLQAKDNGWTDAGSGDNSQLLSPAYTYNKCNYGHDQGSSMYANGLVLQTVGVSRWTYMPYDSADAVSWGNESAWRDAPSYRIDNIYYLGSPSSTADVNTVKYALESGLPVTMALDAGSYGNFGSDDVLGSSALYGSINHGNCIVGFDDSKVDIETGETGAFKVVNSWGSWWGPTNNGFYWLTYDALISGDIVDLTWFDDRYTTETPSLLGVWEYSATPDRDADVTLRIGPIDPASRTPWWNGHSEVMHTYPSFMCLDISQFSDEWTPLNNEFYLDIGDAVGTDGIIASFTVEYYESYVPGAPTQVSDPASGTPKATPGTVMTTMALNDPPGIPINPLPANGATDVSIDPTLQVDVNDPDGGSLDVSFYNGSDDSLIGIDAGVSSGGQASVVWTSLAYSTGYSWYAIAHDGTVAGPASPTWSFTTQAPPNNPPVASFTFAPTHPSADQLITFTDTSSDADGSIINWTWNFDDGSGSYDQNPNHGYPAPGIYSVILTVKDDDFVYNSTTRQVTVYADYWDNTSNPPHTYIIPPGNIGIGTDQPTDKLHINGCLRVDGTFTPHLFFVNSANETIGIGTNAPSYGLDIHQKNVRIYNPVGYSSLLVDVKGIQGRLGSDLGGFFFVCGTNGKDVKFLVTQGGVLTHALRLMGNSNGAVFNEGGLDRDLRVETTGNTHMFFIDASTNYVGVGTNSPEHTLHVSGAINLDPIATPSAPTTGFVIYCNSSDGDLYAMDSAGATTLIASGP